MSTFRAIFLISVLLLLAPAAFAQEQGGTETATKAAEEAEASAVPTPAVANDTEMDTDGMRISRIAVCEDVQERTPIGESAAFNSDIGKLYCFTHIEGADAPTQIFHRWYVGDRLINEIPIDIKGERWRCWSRKTILERWQGDCRVEILTEAGDILGEMDFALTTPDY